jgi:4-hydroxy-tetrahydrodipicolinate reductase
MAGAVVRAIGERSDAEVAGAFRESQQLPDSGEGIDVLIDFTSPEGAMAHARWCMENGVALVTGTTGLEESHQAAVDAASERVAVVQSPNMSVGVNLLFDLARRATGMLGEGADIEIVETHHRYKMDAPSGTAIRLGEVIAEVRETTLEQSGNYGREGMIGPRPPGEIGMMTLRGGDVVGEHTATFFLEGERVEITHRATDRAIFARGAVRAAVWVAGRDPGAYAMADVLGS